ncbi:MAG: GNAT family N-acetyltransferase [Candidatus Zixiibacteriota bacterium]
MTIRVLRKEDLAAYGAICRYAFAMSESYTDVYTKWVQRQLKYTRGAFDGNRLVAGMWYYPYQMRVGTELIGTGGVAAVATRPEARNGGLVRQMMLSSHRQMRDEGYPLAALMPFKNSFYAAMGYADAFMHREYHFTPAHLAPVTGAKGMSVLPVDGAANWEVLEALRQRCGAARTGTVRRDAAYWDVRYFKSWQGIRNVYLIQATGSRKRLSTPMGFLVTTLSTEEGFGKVRLRVSDAGWLNNDALAAILRFLRSHRDQVKTVQWFTPADVDLFPWFSDPGIECNLRVKMMLKLVDLAGALEKRTFPAGLNDSLHLQIDGDSTSPWNTGDWRVDWEAGQARVKKVKANSRKIASASCDIQTLAVLYSGLRTASTLREEGRLSVSDKAMTTLEQAFPSACPHMEEWF